MPNRRILVVDSQRMLGFIETFLTSAGYQVVTSTGGKEATDILMEETPGAVLMDMTRFGPDNSQFLDQAKRKGIPILACGIDNSWTEEALKRGARCFIIKPFDFDQLLMQLNKATDKG